MVESKHSGDNGGYPDLKYPKRKQEEEEAVFSSSSVSIYSQQCLSLWAGGFGSLLTW